MAIETGDEQAYQDQDACDLETWQLRAYESQLHRATEKLSKCQEVHRPASWAALLTFLKHTVKCQEGVKVYRLDPSEVLAFVLPGQSVEAERAKTANDLLLKYQAKTGWVPIADVPQAQHRIECQSRHVRAEKMKAAELARWILSQSYLTLSTPVESVAARLVDKGVVISEGTKVTYDFSVVCAPPEAAAQQLQTIPSPLKPEPEKVELCPRFEDMGLTEDLLHGVYAYGLEEPSLVQQHIMPMLDGRCAIVSAVAGTGATVALAVITLHRIEMKPETQAVILTCGREQALQTQRLIVNVGEYLQVQCQCLIGGESVGKGIRGLRQQRPQVVVATVGRVKDMISKRHLPTHCIRIMVLDQVDALLDADADSISDIRRSMPKTLQVCCFSATVSNHTLHRARKLAEPHNLLEINAGMYLQDQLRHFFIPVEKEEWKLDTLCDLHEVLLTDRQSIVFFSTRRKVDFVHEQMRKHHLTCSALHGDLDQSERNLVVLEFASGAARVLLTGDLFERGMDVQQVNVVVNYDLPDCTSYIHRAARAGRYGRKGAVVSFVTDNEMKQLERIGEHLGKEIEEMPLNITELI